MGKVRRRRGKQPGYARTPRAKSVVSRSDYENRALEVWKVCQEATNHFTDVLIRIRTGAFFFAGAAFSGVITLAEVKGHDLGQSFIGFILLGLAFPWLSFYFLDRFYYHLLLQASVIYSKKVERRMGTEMSTYSEALTRFNMDFPLPIPFLKLKSGAQKVSFFYAIPFSIALGFAGGLLAEPIRIWLVEITGWNLPFDLGVVAGAIVVILALLLFVWFEKKASERFKDPTFVWPGDKPPSFFLGDDDEDW